MYSIGKIACAVTGFLMCIPAAWADEGSTMDAKHLADAQKMVKDGAAFLLSKQEADGGWSMGPGGVHKPAVTALALKALVGPGGVAADAPAIKKGFEVLLGYRQKNGGIYDPRQGVSSYTTAIAISALVAGGNPQFKPAIDDAVKYLKGLQIKPGSESPDGKIVPEGDPRIGGVDYGKSGEPNLSVLGFVVESWKDAGLSGDDPNMQAAVAFLARVQNRSESNPSAIAKEGSNDGGFFYAPKESKAVAGAGERGLRSYGSMTYVGFKSLLYAGLAKDDPRVRAAFDWIRTYWRLDSNPNMPQLQSLQGLYYYYQAMAKALRANGEPIITDTKGGKHNWREELIDALRERVKGDGSWINDADRWEEGKPVLVTAYSLIALQEILKQ